MVSPTDTPELAEVTEEVVPTDEVVAESDDAVEGTVTEETPEPQEEVTPDPSDARLTAVETALASLNGLDPDKVNPAIGRVSALQSEIAEIKSADPLAAIDPRITANENLLTALVQNIINDDVMEESAKGPLRIALAELAEVRTQREKDALKREVLAEVNAATTPEAPKTAAVDPAWASATQDVLDSLKASHPDFDAATIPQEVWAAGVATQSPIRAVLHVTNWVAENQSDTAAENIATRKEAAGGGTPTSSGGATTIETLLSKLTEEGPKALTADQLKQVDAHLGIK